MAVTTANGMAVALDLFQFAVELQTQTYRREHPDADDEDVREFVQQWLLARPGAPNGDGVGHARALSAQ